jgi:hypothetical protein
MTEKENYLRLLHGECPDHIPVLIPIPGSDIPPAQFPYTISLLNQHRLKGGGKDIWGVEYVPTYETGNALLPKPNDFILDDITRWRDVIKAPDLSDYNWEMILKKELDELPIDRNQTGVNMSMHVGYFQNLMAFMGFSNGLCAMYEEPDEVLALFDYLCDFYCTVTEKVIDIVKPDIYGVLDDTAAWAAPFISDDMYREMVLPYHDRQIKYARDRGIPIGMHNCGKCQTLVEDWIKAGIRAWDPAQTCNDLKAVKNKFGGDIVICGGWDATGRLLAPDVTDEEIRQSVKDLYGELAPSGGFAFLAAYLGPLDDPEVERKNKVLLQSAYDLGLSFYM